MPAGQGQGERGGHSRRLRGVLGSSVLLGLGWALVYLVLATPRLEVAGLYYDEVHQAPAAFALTQAPHSVAAYRVAGVPVLNMPYSGAIKSSLYGLGLRLFDQPFTATSWRWLGCAITACGIFAVCAAFGAALSRPAAMVLGFLLATDGTVLLATRHDWGPVALALMLRLALLAVWVRDWQRERPRTGASFALGALVGFAVFEKLSSVVLLVPLAAALVCDPRRRTRRHAWAAVAGGAVGSLPLLGVNQHSWLTQGQLVSLTGGVLQPPSWPALSEFLPAYEALGAGGTLMSWILGQPAPAWAGALEGLAVGAASLAILAAAWAAGPDARRTRAAAGLIAVHLATGLAVVALPTTTWVHHWVIGTPFQYAAFAFATAACRGGEVRGPWARRALRGVVLPAVALLMLARVPSLVALESALRAGSTSPLFEPSTLRLGEWAARQPGDSVFLATEWGVSLPIVSVSSGELAVPELYWDYAGRDDLLRAVGDAPRFFLVAWYAGGTHPGQTERILADARGLPGFREQPVGPEAAYWRTARAWRFERRGPAGAPHAP